MRPDHLPLRLPSFLIFLALGIISLAHRQAFAFDAPEDKLATLVTPSGKSISLEIAETVDKRATGLMFRQSLEPDHGMLFIFPEMGYWTFWMKNTLIPLDILWMDESWKIIHVASRVPICTKTDDSCPRYSTTRESRYVLEIHAGMAQELGLSPGKQPTVSLPSK